ncbi:Uncharacterized conserved protein YfaS, alpha-2-macroglobulin family [Dethiosulfatibacter aminovorans DSM 17477]|uniref:Uncharacterized conserved protein YfaS, alpha-2-macroglobulin family n=1 Tax=Dethiosulfatibacter aminovorans DSM 17477 TaxID=1121476 RepID=A0A1M6ELJ8_9FIRM|nr:Ig-like domain-containing alpha-2-macroglobulin family protein [Dethiosulfatibacter aminovorans]SHI86333.1 Uncharacterized conserved protein YfaS, alpha-2-macroglobulin family [Dethiosulfatibacter aminovorans DSM 17477]
MKIKVIAILLCLAMVITSCGPKGQAPGETGTIGDLGEWDFAVYASDSDSTGIATNTEFIVKSKNTVTVDFLKNSINISPEINFEIEKTSDKEFAIKPDKELKKDAIYRVSLTDEENSYDLSWAFQTKKELKVIGSIPGNKSTYIPVNSGIEIMFSHKNIENFEESFEIQPEAEGTFTQNGYSMIFVPEVNLSMDTTYTVTVKAGARVKDSRLELQEDYVFSFTTVSTERNTLLSISSVVNYFTTRQNHFIEANVYRDAVGYGYNVDIYAFKTSEDFMRDLRKYDETFSFDNVYEGFDKQVPDYLESVASFTSKPQQTEIGWYTMHSFDIPEDLDQGYYLARISYKEHSYFTYIHVNGLLVYNGKFEEDHFFWTLDCNTNEAVADAEITVNDEFSGKTGRDGTTSFGYEDDDDAYIDYATIDAAGYPTFVMRSVRSFYPYYMEYDGIREPGPVYSQASNDYWKYLFTDRSTYLPTDQLNLYGYIKPKVSGSGKYKVSMYSNVNGSYLLDSKNVSITNTGTFTESFSWEDLTPGWYNLLVEDGDTLVLRKEFYINEYTKPIYKVDGKFDKDYIPAGEKITFNVDAGFFDGTPVPGMEFTYNMNLDSYTSGRLVTDENGNASITLTPTMSTTSWRPAYGRMEIYNTNAEDYRITDYDYFTFLPKDKMLELEYDDERDLPQLTLLLHELDSDKYSTDYGFNYEDMRGKPLSGQVKVVVTETWYERVETGKYYDYINKVTRRKYEYIKHDKIVEDRYVDIVDGKYILEMPYTIDSENSFKVEATYEDNSGKIVEKTSFSYFRRLQTVDFNPFYALKVDDDDYRYALGDVVKYYLDNDGMVEDGKNDKMMVMYLKDGLLDYEIIDKTSGEFIFEEVFLPNIMIQAIYSNEGLMRKTSYPINISYDYSERELGIEVVSDKKDYGPGDNVKLSVKTTDAEGNPYPADVNLSIVDEAYFDLYSQTADMLADIYASVYGTGIVREFVSSENPMNDMRMAMGAEMGGDEAAYYVRSEFKDTATFMTLSTDDNGVGTIDFNLPDNLTSWRITYQGVNDKMEASTGWLNVNSRLPFHVSTILSKVFITGDKPSISLRIFGDETKKGEEVSFKVVLQKDGEESTREIQKDGLVGDYTNISLGELEKGSYTITSYAKGISYTDAMEEHFEVVDTTVYFDNQEYFDLTEDTIFDEVYSNAKVTFFNENESNYYKCLLDLRYSSGKRIDQILAGMEARKFIKENFEKDIDLWEVATGRYQNYDGGIRLLPYSDSDSFMSARIALMKSSYFNVEPLKGYFNGILRDSESDIHSVVDSLAGLSTMNEPVLISIYDLLDNEDLSSLDRIVLALGLESLGDITRAKEVYDSVVAETVSTDGQLEISIDEDMGLNYTGTGLLATLSAKLGDYDTGDLLFNHIYENPSKYEIAYLEEITYIENRDIMDTEEIKGLTGKATVKYGDKKETVEIFGFETATLTITAEDLENMEVIEVIGNMGVNVYALGGVEDLEENRTGDFEIERTYTLDGIESSEFSQSDLIKVTIRPTAYIMEDSAYEITDFIPAGFRFIKSEGGWHELQEQKIVMYYYSHNGAKPLVYYVQAVMPGTYTSDHAVITRLGHEGVNFTEQVTLTIQ